MFNMQLFVLLHVYWFNFVYMLMQKMNVCVQCGYDARRDEKYSHSAH
jgi:hypothetical protein